VRREEEAEVKWGKMIKWKWKWRGEGKWIYFKLNGQSAIEWMNVEDVGGEGLN
jgi:hypothetical protein